MKQDSTSALLALLREIAFERKRVTLASGKESDFYIDCRKVSLHQEGLVLCGNALYDAYKSSGTPVTAVGGPTLGADPLIASFAYAAYLDQNALPSFIVRKEAKGHGAGKWIEGMSNIPEGSEVLILEDVVTTGGSTVRTIHVCRDHGLRPTTVMALVDRCEGGRQAIEETGVVFSSLFTRHDFMGDGASDGE